MSELDVSEAMAGIGQTTRLRIIVKSVANFGVVETEQQPQTPLWVEGVLQSLHPRSLLVKPEGQREWRWWTFWCAEKLKLDWELQDYNLVRYRVMSRQDWSQGEYYEYELTEGATP